MHVGIVRFPGSNCDIDIVNACNSIAGVRTKILWHKDTSITNLDVILLPGGFAYGDYLRSGAIARFSPIMQEVAKFAKKGGRVLGICNGFQVLTEAHLLPGALLKNQAQNFICHNAYINIENNTNQLTQLCTKGETLTIPIAHGEGRYFDKKENILKLEDNGQILFRYTDKSGKQSERDNPNGSINNIAGIMNNAGNVFGMMPHPERAADQDLGNTDGLKLLKGLLG